MKTEDELFEKSLDLAADTIKCGGEIRRAEETVMRINSGKAKVFALPSLIIAEKGSTVRIRRIKSEETDLARLAKINSISRALSGDISDCKNYAAPDFPACEIICNFGATASFSLFFGGNFADALFAGIIGIFITSAGYKKINFPLFSSNLVDSFFAASLAFLTEAVVPGVHRDKIIIGTIMLLVPGLTVVNAIRDMMSSDIVAGLLELFGAVSSALSIALGVAGASLIFASI